MSPAAGTLPRNKKTNEKQGIQTVVLLFSREHPFDFYYMTNPATLKRHEWKRLRVLLSGFILNQTNHLKQTNKHECTAFFCLFVWCLKYVRNTRYYSTD